MIRSNPFVLSSSFLTHSAVALLFASFGAWGCSGASDPTKQTDGSGGEVSVGGAATPGGSSAISAGGAAATGGSFAVGGNSPTGGSVNSTATGGADATGGKAATGGSISGSPTGGANATGGKTATGGSNPVTATGGGSTTGGKTATGGSGVVATTGGNGSTGGTSTSGGTSAGGGSTSDGGGTFVEDSTTDCTVGAMPTTMTSNAKLPDPFKKLDGTRVAAKADWHCRRAEIKKLAETFAYGSKDKPTTVTGPVSNTGITVNVSSGGKTSSFTATISLPTTGKAPYPAVIVYGGMAADTATILGEGVAVINYDPYSCGKEGTGRASKQGAYYTIAGSTSTTGLLVAWGWGVSRIIDVIAQDGKVLKADAIGVTGCSRFGKGAFIAGVFDERVALTMPEESGSAGVPIWRGIPGEGAQTLRSAYGEQPWFGDAFSAFTSDPTKAPLDTHEAIALIAPRGLFIMENPHIANLGPKSGHAAALAGLEVYKALGAGSNFTYWSDVADGSHCAIRPEWKVPMQQNIRKFLTKTANDPGVFKPSATATSSLATWVDWTTPTLN